MGAIKNGRMWIKIGVAHAFTFGGLLELMARARRAAAGPQVHVLAYHRVVDKIEQGGLINTSLCISTDAFARQMEQARELFQVMPLEDVVGVLRGEIKLKRDACAITFDDGYRDVRLRAQPILRSLRLPATVFVPTGPAANGCYLPHDRLYAGLAQLRRRRRRLTSIPLSATRRRTLLGAELLLKHRGPQPVVEMLIRKLPAEALESVIDGVEQIAGGPWPRDPGAQVLSPDELCLLGHSGFEIAAHTIGHVVLTHEPTERVRQELEQPRRDLESWTGRPCRFFSYCNGYHSPEVIQAVKTAGYLAAVTTCDRPNRNGGDVFRIGRRVLWEAHACGLDGRWSPSLSAAHLHGLFNALGMTAPVSGELTSQPMEVRE